MKKIFFAVFAFCLAISAKVFAQIDLLGVEETADTAEVQKKLSEADFFSDFIEDVEAEKTAKAEAKQMLKENPKILKLRQSQLKELEKNRLERDKIRQKFLSLEQQKMKPEEKVLNIKESYETAPLGLNWGISTDKMQEIGYELEEFEREDYPNSYLIKNAPEKGLKFYKNVIVSFGENKALWCINAQTPAQKDDSSAHEILKLYKKYFEALEQKYGSANEHFTPYSYEQEISEDDGEEAITRTIKKENPLGNSNFLNELQTGKAELYATFHNNTIGVTLSVYVDENGLAQLVLDYKNLPLMKKEKEAFINNL